MIDLMAVMQLKKVRTRQQKHEKVIGTTKTQLEEHFGPN